jgi:thiamine pyrophosphate-dependent acetolactate synthase large subunit-like protein
MNKLDAIKKIIKSNVKAIFIISNGLTSRISNNYLKNNKSFYLLHAMGEALSVGIGIANFNKKLKIVVIDGDYNALMGSASWHHLKEYKNIKYYILKNGVSETTGSQKIPKIEMPKKLKINIIRINNQKIISKNPEEPNKIKKNFKNHLKILGLI